MKTIGGLLRVLVVVGVCFAVPATAQIHTSRGSFVLGSRIGFSTASSDVEVKGDGIDFNGDGGSAYQINVHPGIGYFFLNNFAVGVSMEYIANGNQSPVDFENPDSEVNETSNTDILFGPFLRLFLPVGEDQAFFIGGTLGFGSSDDEFNDGTSTQSIHNRIVTYGVGPGYTIFARNGLALEMLAQYNFARAENDINVQGVSRSSTTRTNAFDFSVGIQYYFGGAARRAAGSDRLRDIMAPNGSRQ